MRTGLPRKGLSFCRSLPKVGWFAVAAGLYLWLGGGQAATAQDDSADKPLYQQQPFDVLVVKRDGSRHKVQPLDLPTRKFQPQSAGYLKFRFLEDPSEEFAIRWSDIERIEFYEGMLLAEARRLIGAQKLDEAFRHLLVLLDRYPNTEGLEPVVQEYLFARASDDAAQGRWTEALSALEELYRRNADYVGSGGRSVVSALNSTAATILDDYLKRQDYRSARRLLIRLTSTYGAERLPVLAEVRQRMIQQASQTAAEARQLLDAGKLREAQQASLHALHIWPKLEGGVELARDIAQRYPIVVVGVAERAFQGNSSAIDNWATRRTGRLIARSIVEFVGPGAEGGLYVSPLGTLERSDDYQQLWLQMPASRGATPTAPNAYDVARLLLRFADPQQPDHLDGWADLVRSVRADGMARVEVTLRRPYVVPEAMLRIPFSTSYLPAEWLAGMQPYLMQQQTPSETLFVRNPAWPTAKGNPPAEVRERFYEDTRDALDDLRRGEIFVLDRVFPADAAQLLADKDERQIIVRPYSVPVLHLLVPRYHHPYVKNSAFRRALLYAIPRAAILDRLYGGRPVEGCRVLSGPFPAPRTSGDGSAYAYDARLPEQPFDPGLAMLLLGVARQQLATEAEKKMEPAPELTPVVIAHPDETVAKFVCTIIAEQLQRLQIPCQLRVLKDAADEPSADYHLRYVTMVMEEPLVDAVRLLGRGGIAESPNPYVQLALRRVQEATSWRDVRLRMQELHQVLYADAAVLPLFQTIEHYAYNGNIKGLGAELVTLYQDVENWKIEPVLSVDE